MAVTKRKSPVSKKAAARSSKTQAIAIRPLDFVRLPPELDGRSGNNRADKKRLQIKARNDVEAVQAFLAEYDRSPATHRSYQKECERLLLWAAVDCKKPLSGLDRQDFEGYLNFLADPQPAKLWCGVKAKRETPQWRPFVGPLSESAVMTAMAAINSLMAYLVDSGYLAGNPLGLIRQRRRKMQLLEEETTNPAVKSTEELHSIVERFLDPEMWSAITQAIEAMPKETERDKDEYERIRFIASFLILLAPRVGELETHRMNSFRESRGRWWWYVTGKGGKSAKVPVPDDMMTALVRYRQHLGLSDVPRKNDETPLLVSVKNGRPISARRLNQILKRLFQQAALQLTPKQAHKADKLRKASAHWGRHTGITEKVNAGIHERYVQKDARHSDARTTRRYIHEEEDRWHDEAQKQRLRWS
jgi:integrase